MAGIAKITQKHKEDNKSNFGGGKDLFLRDGDQAIVAIVASGEENDHLLDDYFQHTVNSTDVTTGANRFNSVVCGKTTGKYCDLCAKGQPSRRRFAVWMYVYFVYHTEKKRDDWKEVQHPAGGKLFKEDVNDFRVFSQGFGSRDYLWNQLVDIHFENEGLNKKKVRVKRTGAGRDDTSYSIQVFQNAPVDLSKDILVKIKNLPSVLDYITQKESDNESNKAVSLTQKQEEAVSEKPQAAVRTRKVSAPPSTVKEESSKPEVEVMESEIDALFKEELF